jgi:hypothetical protein
MPKLLLFAVPVLILVVLEVFLVYKAGANRKRARLLADTPVTKVAELAFGPAQVQGRVVALAEPMVAPLSGKPCVYYCFTVEEKRTVRHGLFHTSSHWKTVIDDARSIAWGVADDTGTANLDLGGAELILKPGTQFRSGFWNDAPPTLERVLNERYGRSSKGLLFNKGMRYSETLIEPGDDLLVLGQWETGMSGAWQFGKGSGPYIVSNQSLGALRSSDKGFAWLWAILALLVLVVPCALFGVRLSLW